MKITKVKDCYEWDEVWGVHRPVLQYIRNKMKINEVIKVELDKPSYLFRERLGQIFRKDRVNYILRVKRLDISGSSWLIKKELRKNG